jgi:heme oxygenase
MTALREQLLYQHTAQAPAPFPPLSLTLRQESAQLHERIEATLRLPDAIRDAADYRAWLLRYLGFYAPLECLYRAFEGWTALGIELSRHARSGCLDDDLAALAVDRTTFSYAAPDLLPDLPTLSHALGSLYVVEGSRLGGRVILRHLERRMGPEIAGATRFFRGDTAAPAWQSFRATLDGFGFRHPELRTDVVVGAKRTFVSLEKWFATFCAERQVRHERR